MEAAACEAGGACVGSPARRSPSPSHWASETTCLELDAAWKLLWGCRPKEAHMGAANPRTAAAASWLLIMISRASGPGAAPADTPIELIRLLRRVAQDAASKPETAPHQNLKNQSAPNAAQQTNAHAATGEQASGPDDSRGHDKEAASPFSDAHHQLGSIVEALYDKLTGLVGECLDEHIGTRVSRSASLSTTAAPTSGSSSGANEEKEELHPKSPQEEDGAASPLEFRASEFVESLRLTTMKEDVKKELRGVEGDIEAYNLINQHLDLQLKQAKAQLLEIAAPLESALRRCGARDALTIGGSAEGGR
eukprot:GHVT01059277.1.p1 GENE.GHVT01059277.1~~GHVT01059277.1.p1  ORF type:complete len:308 (+),score=89.30 GHVT01059277.1:423-1346(+)